MKYLCIFIIISLLTIQGIPVSPPYEVPEDLSKKETSQILKQIIDDIYRNLTKLKNQNEGTNQEVIKVIRVQQESPPIAAYNIYTTPTTNQSGTNLQEAVNNMSTSIYNIRVSTFDVNTGTFTVVNSTSALFSFSNGLGKREIGIFKYINSNSFDGISLRPVLPPLNDPSLGTSPSIEWYDNAGIIRFGFRFLGTGSAIIISTYPISFSNTNYNEVGMKYSPGTTPPQLEVDKIKGYTQDLNIPAVNITSATIGTLSNTWQKIFDYEASTGVNNVDITGLNGDKDIMYMLNFRGVNGTGQTSKYYRVIYGTGTGVNLYYDSTAANYYFQFIGANAAVVSANGGVETSSGCSIGFVGANINESCFSQNTIYAKSGKTRNLMSIQSNRLDSSGADYVETHFTNWSGDNNKNITALRITGTSANNCLGAGSRIELYAIIR